MLARSPDTIMDARPAVDHIVRVGADRILANRMLVELTLELQPFSADTMTTDSLTEVCRGRLAVMRDLGLRAHHAYSASRMLGLRQVELALAEVRSFGSWSEARRARAGQRQFADAAE